MAYFKEGGSVRRTLLDPQEATDQESMDEYSLSAADIGTWIKTNWMYLAGALAVIVIAWFLLRNREGFTHTKYF